MATVLVISFSNLGSDPRVDRQITALLTRHDVVAAGLGPPNHPEAEFIDLTTPPLGLVGGGIGVARLLARQHETAYWRHPRYSTAFQRVSGVIADVVIANDAAALPIAARLGPPVVFDAHEYAPEQFTDQWWWGKLVAPYVRWQCREYIPQVAAMTTVSPGIADAYAREFGVRATVVTNAPPFAEIEPGPVGDPVRILHHGLAASGRGLEEMLQLAHLLEDRFVIDFVLVESTRGYRDHLVRKAKGNPKVSFPPPVPMRELVSMASRYDIGLFLLPPINLHRMHALPNKLFEFIQGRLAVAIGPSPEMAAVVRRYGCGVVASDYSPRALADQLNALDAGTIAEFKRASHLAAPELNAEKNADLTLDAVDIALRSRR